MFVFSKIFGRYVKARMLILIAEPRTIAPNPFHVLEQNLLTAAIIEFRGPTVGWPAIRWAASKVPSFSRKFVMLDLAERTCILAQEFKRISAGLFRLCMNGFPERNVALTHKIPVRYAD